MMYLRHIVPNFILVFSMIIIWHKLLNKKINFKDQKLYISIIGLMIISVFNYLTINRFIRVIIITIIFMFFFKFLFKENIHKTIVTPIFYQILVFVSEFIAFILLTFIMGSNINSFIETFLGIFIVNISVAIVSILIANFKFIKTLFNKMLKITERIKIYQLFIVCIISFLFLNIFVISAYYKVNYYVWVITNILLISVLFIIVLYMLKTQNNYNKVSDKYNIAIKSLNDYENMMTKYRIANHENKNLLLTIRAMILNKEKDIPKYIDSMIEDKYEDDEKLLFNMSVIPSGGLRAAIYSEIMKIKDIGINYTLNIDKNLRSVDLIELDTNTIIDACKIIGVFIDNAIDEVKRLKNKNIQISIYLENKTLNISVSNNYKGKIEISRISDDGYTTKGKGHGYGLSLVKEIVKNNNLFDNKQEITKDIFNQILIIKYKKSH